MDSFLRRSGKVAGENGSGLGRKRETVDGWGLEEMLSQSGACCRGLWANETLLAMHYYEEGYVYMGKYRKRWDIKHTRCKEP